MENIKTAVGDDQLPANAAQFLAPGSQRGRGQNLLCEVHRGDYGPNKIKLATPQIIETHAKVNVEKSTCRLTKALPFIILLV
jgi:hypothetical protein